MALHTQHLFDNSTSMILCSIISCSFLITRHAAIKFKSDMRVILYVNIDGPHTQIHKSKPNGLVFFPNLRIHMFNKLIEMANADNSIKLNNTRLCELAEYLLNRLIYN